MPKIDIPETVEARFVSAWMAVKNPELDGWNPHYKSRYATLGSTNNVIREACKPYGIAYCQRLDITDDGQLELNSLIMSNDGTKMSISTFPVTHSPNPQTFGNNMTYAKRQQAQADWGITGDEDDDGNLGAAEAEKAANKAAVERFVNQSAANSRQRAPQSKANGKEPTEAKRDRYIKKINDLTAKATSLGIKQDGIDSFIQTSFNGTPIEELSLQQLTVLGKHLAQLIADKEELTNG